VVGATRDTAGSGAPILQGCHLLWLPFQAIRTVAPRRYAVPQPREHLRAPGLGLSHFDRLYSGNLD